MLSYITNRHGSRDYNTIVEKGNVKVSQRKLMHVSYRITSMVAPCHFSHHQDIDDTDKKRFCEYIFYRGLIRWVCAIILWESGKRRLFCSPLQTWLCQNIPRRSQRHWGSDWEVSDSRLSWSTWQSCRYSELWWGASMDPLPCHVSLHGNTENNSFILVYTKILSYLHQSSSLSILYVCRFGKLFFGHYYDESTHHFHMNTPKYFRPKQ